MTRRLVAALALAGLLVVGAPTHAQQTTHAQQDVAGRDRPQLSESTAQVLVDSLMREVVALRGLRQKRELRIHVAGRDWVRKRLEEIIVEDNIEPRAREEERVLRYLGLIPGNVDLIELYKDLIEEQLAGMYDIAERVLVLANWLPSQLQTPVVTHELVHALQDQHFSLRVRKKLGFETPDAEVSWQALIEGDATAAMLQTSFRALGPAWVQVLDSLGTAQWDTKLEANADRDLPAQRYLAAPRVIRQALGFPYQQGLSFVGALYREGGWERVDEAYLRPPVSTEQILHPERFIQQQDMPIRIDVPDMRGVLGAGYERTANMALGEYDLYLYLSQYADGEMARVASAGWGGAWISLYDAPEGDPDALVMVTTWDTDDDAYEFFGSIIGALEKRYPGQHGDLEATSGERVVWNVDPAGRYQNVVRLVGRRVQILEQIPAAVVTRSIQKLDRLTKFDDPTPQLRASTKAQLPWTELKKRVTASDSVLTLQVDRLPHGWVREPLVTEVARTEVAAGATADKRTPTDVGPGADAGPKAGAGTGDDASTTTPGGTVVLQAASWRSGGELVLRARRQAATLEIVVDRQARDRLGISGFAHALASRIQQSGSNVFLKEDEPVKRDDLSLYEVAFSQTQDGRDVVYYIAVADLRHGYGYVVMAQPDDGATPSVARDFDELLETLAPAPWTPPAKTRALVDVDTTPRPERDAGSSNKPTSPPQPHGG